MLKWVKTSLILLALGLALVLGLALTGVYMYRGKPRWYRPISKNPEEIKAAASRADQKLLDVLSWAAAARAQVLRKQNGITDPNEPVVGSKTVTFDETELNSFVGAWENPDRSDLQEKMAHYFTDGRLALESDSIILAGQSADFGTLASAQFSANLNDQGNLNLALQGISAGMLPVPQSAVAGELGKVKGLLGRMLVKYQSDANIDSTLIANRPAVAASWIRLLMNALYNQPSDPYLFVPFDLHNLGKAVPVKLSSVHVEEGTLKLTLDPLSSGDQIVILDHLKRPYSMAPTPPAQ